MILGRGALEASLPGAVEAFVFTNGTGADSDPKDAANSEGRARAGHAAFLSRYNLSVTDVPLLRVRPVERFWTPWAVEGFEDVS